MSLEQWFIGAIALLRRTGADDRDEWLAHWNATSGVYQFIEAHKLEEESFRDSLEREIAWTTTLKSGRDYLIASGPKAHLQFIGDVEADEEPAEQEKRVGYIVEFFLVELMGREHPAILEQERIAWLDADAIRTGRASDGRPISQRMLALARRADLFPEWRRRED